MSLTVHLLIYYDVSQVTCDCYKSTETICPSIITAHQEAGGWHCRSVAVWSNGSSTWTAVSWVEGAVAGQQW